MYGKSLGCPPMSDNARGNCGGVRRLDVWQRVDSHPALDPDMAGRQKEKKSQATLTHCDRLRSLPGHSLDWPRSR